MDATAIPSSTELFDKDAVDTACTERGLVSALRAALAEASAVLDDQFKSGRNAGELLRERAALMDELLRYAWTASALPTADFALVAVGGYGRGELHPASDIDLLILAGDALEDSQGKLEKFLTLLWDLGLQIGHSVRSVDECIAQAAADITVLTNLIEARPLYGDASLLSAVHEGTSAEKMWPAEEFFRAKVKEQEARHEKYADTEYSLEPNIKGSPGGLRDLQLIGWLARRHFGWRSIEELRTNNFLTGTEAETIIHGQEFLWRVRYALHMITGREEDRLLFDHQRELARIWGFEDGDKLAVEQFMQLYYRWALALSQLNDVLILVFDQAVLQGDTAEEVIAVDDHFELRNRFISARRDSVFREYPGALLEVFVHAGNHPQARGINAATIRLIRDHLHLIDDSFRANAQHKALFLDILRSNRRMTRQLRNMSRYGILGRYLPAYGSVVGQMQHDLFHSYTVDAHTLLVIENMRRFLKPEHDERFPVTSRVARRLPHIELLYIAGLFHDIGKGRGGDHSELGAVDARAFCEDHGLSDHDADLVEWLVRNHLLMSAVSQSKDISDPAVIQEFARHVGNQDRLDFLFTLTVADINGTNPKLWNAWRGSLLRQLYTETTRMLEYRGFTAEELERLWSERGDDYFLRERAEDIAWHTEAIANHVDGDKPLVLLRNGMESSVANTTQIFIYAPFDIGAFSRTCSRLEQLDLSIHDARIYHGKDGMSLDTYFILDSSGKAIEDPERLRYIGDFLGRSLGPDTSATGIVPRLTPRRVRSFHVDTETRMSTDKSRGVTVLELVSLDRPGLLARIGEVFVEHNVVLQAAKIQTLGERVQDVFFITDLQQRPIEDEELQARIQQAIRENLDAQQAA